MLDVVQKVRKIIKGVVINIQLSGNGAQDVCIGHNVGRQPVVQYDRNVFSNNVTELDIQQPKAEKDTITKSNNQKLQGSHKTCTYVPISHSRREQGGTWASSTRRTTTTTKKNA